MNRSATLNSPWPTTFRPLRWLSLLLALILCACGGGDDPAGPVPVGIIAQPVSASVTVGSAATFSVTASGDGISYQWQRSSDNAVTWVNIPGATSATYTTAVVDASLNGYQYRVVIGGAVNSITTSAVTLTVAPAVVPPAITVQPANQSLAAGADASFSVTATGTSLAYQWQSSPDGSTWTNLSGATNATLTLAAVAATDSGKRLRVVIGNSAGSVTSNPALLTVSAPVPAAPVITTQPAAASVAAPQTATFTVAASGTPLPGYQWQLSTDGGTTYTDIAQATSASYTTPATTTADTGKRFRVRVSNSQGSVLSTGVVLNVTVPAGPVITAQPADQSVTVPAAATFSVTAAGTPTPTYQWQLSTDSGVTFSNINGATSASYTTPATVIGDSGKRFRVVVTNSGGSTTSGNARLTVNAPAGGGGSGGSASCAPWGMPAGTTVQTTVANPGNAALAGIQTLANNGTVVFSGHSATELALTQPLGATTLNTKLYASFDGTSGAATLYGSVTQYSVTSGGSTTAQNTSSVLTPPVVDYEFTLAPGQSVTSQTETSVDTTTTTANGVTSAPTTTTRTSSSPATTFVGFETVTVAAGTFNTCRYLTAAGNTNWTLVGYGSIVKDSQGSSATSILVNGVALTHN